LVNKYNFEKINVHSTNMEKKQQTLFM